MLQCARSGKSDLRLEPLIKQKGIRGHHTFTLRAESLIIDRSSHNKCCDFKRKTQRSSSMLIGRAYFVRWIAQAFAGLFDDPPFAESLDNWFAGSSDQSFAGSLNLSLAHSFAGSRGSMLAGSLEHYSLDRWSDA